MVYNSFFPANTIFTKESSGRKTRAFGSRFPAVFQPNFCVRQRRMELGLKFRKQGPNVGAGAAAVVIVYGNKAVWQEDGIDEGDRYSQKN